MNIEVPAEFCGKRFYGSLTTINIAGPEFYEKFGIPNISKDQLDLSVKLQSSLQLEGNCSSKNHIDAEKFQVANYALCIMNKHQQCCKDGKALTSEQKIIIFNFLIELPSTTGIFQFLHEFLVAHTCGPQEKKEKNNPRSKKTAVKSIRNTKQRKCN